MLQNIVYKHIYFTIIILINGKIKVKSLSILHRSHYHNVDL